MGPEVFDQDWAKCLTFMSWLGSGGGLKEAGCCAGEQNSGHWASAIGARVDGDVPVCDARFGHDRVAVYNPSAIKSGVQPIVWARPDQSVFDLLIHWQHWVGQRMGDHDISGLSP
jgi:hypothetical protein